jgi:hypothetical protein
MQILQRRKHSINAAASCLIVESDEATAAFLHAIE